MGQEECPRDEEGWERHLRQEGPEPCFGGYLRREVASSHRGQEEDLGLHQVAQAQRGEDHQARQCAEGGVPGGEPRHVEDGPLSASTCPETMSEPRRFGRRVPTPRRALESRPQELDSCNSRWATQSDDSSRLCFLLLSAKRACSFERRLTRSRLELQRQS